MEVRRSDWLKERERERETVCPHRTGEHTYREVFLNIKSDCGQLLAPDDGHVFKYLGMAIDTVLNMVK